MTTRIFITLGLLAIATISNAAETGSGVRLDEVTHAARAWGRGGWVLTKTRADRHFSNASALATDATSISFSNSSAFHALDGQRMGNTLNITVGPGQSATATGHARTHGHPNGVYVRGSSSPSGARVTTKAYGRLFEANAQATRYPDRRLSSN